jgi:flavin-dependent dehydrogenase
MGIGNAMAMAEIAAGEIQSWIKEDRFLAKDTFSYEQKARKKLRNVIVLNTVINLFFSKLDTMTPILLVLVKWRFIVKLLSTSSLLNNITKPGFYLKKMFTKG